MREPSDGISGLAAWTFTTVIYVAALMTLWLGAAHLLMQFDWSQPAAQTILRPVVPYLTYEPGQVAFVPVAVVSLFGLAVAKRRGWWLSVAVVTVPLAALLFVTM